MAEVLGFVASGIAVSQLAGQVAKSIIKLKEYWNQIKEAPSEVVFLMREIESLNVVLGQIQDDQSRNVTPGQLASNLCIQQSLGLCVEGANELSSLVDDFRRKLDGKSGWKRKVGSASVVLHKEDVKKIKRRMKNAIRLLSLSYQLHTNAMIQLQPEIIVARLSERALMMPPNVPEQEPDKLAAENSKELSADLVTRHYQYWTSSDTWLRYVFGTFYYRNSLIKRRGRLQRELSLKYQAPSWLQNRVLEALCSNEMSKLNLSLQTYRIIRQSYFEIRDFIHADDVFGFQNFLQKHQFSIHDRLAGYKSDRTTTTLHLAGMAGSLEICRFLVSQGVSPLVQDYLSQTPLEVTFRRTYHLTREEDRQVGEIVRLLLGHGGADSLIDDTSLLKDFTGQPEIFRLLKNQCFPPYEQLAAAQRFEIALGATRYRVRPPVALWEVSTGENISQEDKANFLDDLDRNLLHHLSYTYCEYLCDVDFRRTRPDYMMTGSENPWRPFIRDFLNAGTPVSATDRFSNTPLYCILQQMEHYISHSNLRFMNSILRCWLVDLKDCGVDLLDYGSEESTKKHRLGSMRFTYGPNPDDWQIWISERTYRFAGQFWSWIENPPDEDEDDIDIQMPGSWNDENDTDNGEIEVDLQSDEGPFH